MLATGVSTFFALVLVTTPERALAFSMLFGVFLCVVQTQPVERRDGRFWLLLGALALIHVPLLALVTFHRFPFGMVVFPFALVDGLAIWAFIKWTEKRFPRA